MAVQSQIEVEQWESESIRAIREEAIRARRDYAELLVEHKKLQAENERLRETLAVFADERSWWQFDTSKDPQTLSMEYKWRSKDNPIEFAQQALEPKE